ncbi:MAG: hypothetical protein II304_03640 [Bacteroidales bacterium]|nr:hypothetical protein [Bacteroidales bacterium]
MSQEWYLMNTNHDTVSGFESDNFENFAMDAFSEALESSLGQNVEICNYDLTIRTPQKVIMNGSVQDTKLNSITRQMLAPIGTCMAGQYVFYKDRYWLIVGLVDDNGFYEKAVLLLCNFLLTWKNRNNKIIQRWACVSSASQYNNGETSNQFMFIRSDQLMILTPRDDECLLIPHKQRFIIDTRCEIYEKTFSPDVIVDTSNELITYEITRMDNVIYNYQNSGHSEYMATQDEQHENDGYYVVNGKGYWLCDIPSQNDNKMEVLSCEIICDEPVVYNSLEPTIFKAKFYDSNGNEIEINPQWELDCDFAENLNIEYISNSICISVNNKKLLNKSFELSLSAEHYTPVTIAVKIKAFM